MIARGRKRTISGDTELWFGVHRGRLCRDVPGSYIVWLHDNMNTIIVDEELLHEAETKALSEEFNREWDT